MEQMHSTIRPSRSVKPEVLVRVRANGEAIDVLLFTMTVLP
jgi:hypothetical protein